MAKIEITQELVRELFDYRDGNFIWKVSPCQTPMLGKVAGTIRPIKNKKVVSIGIKGKPYFAHRLIFIWHHGYLPVEVDHEDRNTLNNKIENLRAATRSENVRNRGSYKNALSKYIGVTKGKNKAKWMAAGSINGKRKHLGVFDTEEEAALAYNNFAVKYYKEFACLNIIHPNG